MTTDNWQQFKEVFQSALELPPDQRPAYLDRVCTDPSLKAELESLLFCYQGPQNASGERPGDERRAESKSPDASRDPLVETFIDHYQIIAKVGDEGSQSVYYAVRIDGSELKQIVVKLAKTNAGLPIHLGKKQKLSLMGIQHPNIARFLDAGVNKDGRCYFVTDYFEGVPIDQYCDSNKLATRARIVLFLKVCQTVQYGHEHFVAHGSLTARHIIVDKNGTPKVLDLGMSGLLDGEQVHSADDFQMSANAAILEYASPGQIRGEPIVAADDVYSLGVLFYQLLTSESPYRVKGGGKDELVPAIFEAIRPSKVLGHIGEQTGPDGRKIAQTSRFLDDRRNETTRTVRKLLAGDLDSIVLKAIQKDPSKRYRSIEQFEADIQRYLEDRPVSSRKMTFFYRADKFIKRHKAAAIAIGFLLTALGAACILLLDSSPLR